MILITRWAVIKLGASLESAARVVVWESSARFSNPFLIQDRSEIAKISINPRIKLVILIFSQYQSYQSEGGSGGGGGFGGFGAEESSYSSSSNRKDSDDWGSWGNNDQVLKDHCLDSSVLEDCLSWPKTPTGPSSTYLKLLNLLFSGNLQFGLFISGFLFVETKSLGGQISNGRRRQTDRPRRPFEMWWCIE